MLNASAAACTSQGCCLEHTSTSTDPLDILIAIFRPLTSHPGCFISLLFCNLQPAVAPRHFKEAL